jgi:hypothetical protein
MSLRSVSLIDVFIFGLFITQKANGVVDWVASYSEDCGLKASRGDWLLSVTLSLFSTVPPRNCQDSTLHYATTTAFHSITYSVFTNHTTLCSLSYLLRREISH